MTTFAVCCNNCRRSGEDDGPHYCAKRPTIMRWAGKPVVGSDGKPLRRPTKVACFRCRKMVSAYWFCGLASTHWFPELG